MTQSSFGRLDRCWRTPLISSVKIKTCSLHTQKCQSVSHCTLLSHHYRRTLLNMSQSRHSSNIIRSPFKDIDIPNKLIPELIWETVDRFPDDIAMVSEKCVLLICTVFS